MGRPSRGYETALIAILSVAYGTVNFEMFGINYLMPFIQPALRLTNTQLGVVVSGYWLAFGCTSYLIGRLVDGLTYRKRLLTWALLVLAGASTLSAFANSFGTLLGARILMGVIEGPLVPLIQSLLIQESPAERRGLNMGIVQNLGSSVMVGFLAPLALVALAGTYSWRAGFCVVLIPSLICAALTAGFLREPVAAEAANSGPSRATGGVSSGANPSNRGANVWLCGLGACFIMAYLAISPGFLPLFYIKVRGFSPHLMSLLMSVLGISGVILGILVPALSDRIGRKPVMISSSLLALLIPLGALYFRGPLVVLSFMMFFGWSLTAAYVLYFATVPSESVSPQATVRTIGLIIAVSTIVGGVLGPYIAGLSADHWSLRAPLLIQAGCAASTALISAFLRETAPSRSVSETAKVLAD